MRRLLARVPFALILGMAWGLGLAAPVQAAFQICNKTALTTRVAIGRFDGTHWSSQGWWTIVPKQCAKLLAGPLDARYYYLYATDGGTGMWDGHTYFCTALAEKFSVTGRGACAARGYDRRGFFQVDTGQSPDWTQSLSN